MTFPAWDVFEADSRIKTRHLRVYRYCRATLDFRQPRYAKRTDVARATTLHQSDVSRTLTALVAWGYLHEHAPDQHGTRRFTLCWSRREGGEYLPPPQTAPEGGAAA